MEFDVFEYTSQGGRSYNEDSVGSCFNSEGGIFIVADGLGGHNRGEEASAAAVETIISGWDFNAEDMPAQINEKFEAANQKILELQQEKRCVMKTTAAVLAVSGNKAVMANSGDSRVYFFHKNELHSYTNDHSVAYKKYKAGEITRKQIGTDEDQSCLLRNLGGADRYLPDITECDVPLESGDAFMLCSDGAWEYLKDTEILIDLLKSKSAEHWAELLMLRIMDRIRNGKNDNLSIITVMIDFR